MLGIINYINRHNPHSKINPKQIGKYIIDGAEGHVFEYGENKVIKFMYVNKLIFQDSLTFYTVMDYLKHHQSKLYADVYEYGQLIYRKRKVLFYITEKLKERKTRVNHTLWESRQGYLLKRGLQFVDFHDWNIMENSEGNQKLIDLTSFVIKGY